MHAELFRENPFSDDDGSITPQLAAALGEPEHLRTEAIVGALGRVLIPVLPHAMPAAGVEQDGLIADADAPTCPDDGLIRVDFPGGRQAFPIFSSVQAVQNWNPEARPVPIDVARMAAVALTRGPGLLTLDPGSADETWLGRSAVAALAGGTDWTAPWDDPLIVEKITEAFDGYVPGLDKIGIQPGRCGSAVLVLYLIPPAERQVVENVVQTVSAVIASEPYVRARLDVIEIRPFYAGA